MWLGICVWSSLAVFGVRVAPTSAKSARIVGGHEVEAGAYPWQIAVYRRHPVNYENISVVCGGSILNNRWVLTAAHCLTKNPRAEMYVITAGEHDLIKDEGTEQNFTVIKLIVHEEYDKSEFSNDIGLLKTDKPIVWNQYIGSIEMLYPFQKDFLKIGQECITSGWGDLKYHGAAPTILRAVEMPLVSHEECEAKFVDKEQAITESMLCAGYIDKGLSPCTGDSGGPLACILNGRWFLVGVTSFGVGCGWSGVPGVFADVALLRSWIVDNIKANGLT